MIYCYLRVCQHIKVCDEIDFDNILFDLALCEKYMRTFVLVFCHLTKSIILEQYSWFSVRPRLWITIVDIETIYMTSCDIEMKHRTTHQNIRNDSRFQVLASRPLTRTFVLTLDFRF